MEEKTRAKFLLLIIVKMVFHKFQILRQNNRTIEEYTEEFYKVQARNSLNEDEYQIVARCINGFL